VLPVISSSGDGRRLVRFWETQLASASAKFCRASCERKTAMVEKPPFSSSTVR
jgi:hypothetical protein